MILAASEPSLHAGALLMGLFGGLALFLFGMEQMTGALKQVAGERMRKLLARLTTNRFKAVSAGAFVTAVIQSSSVTTVLLVGFISAGLMTLSQSIGVILGANIGTTITAQIVAFKVTYYALLLVAVGFALLFFSKQERLRQYGSAVMGLGMIFFGMQVMGDATSPLRNYEPFVDALRQLDNPLTAILVSAAFTAVIQSSSATTSLIIVLAGQGFITLPVGIAMAFGANIGTCVTALLAAIGKPREALQAAVVHVLFNVFGVLLWYFWIDQLALLVQWFSPQAPDLSGAARRAAETPRQIANAHTLFNVANTLIFLPFTVPLARFVQWLIPQRPAEQPQRMRPRYLDDLLLKTPALALDIVRMELGRLGTAAVRMVRAFPATILRGTEHDLDELERMDDDVDALHGAVLSYLGRLSQENLSGSQATQLQDYIAAANYLESTGDMIETNLVAAGRERIRHQVQFSAATQQVLRSLHQRVTWTVQHAVDALVDSDVEKAHHVMEAKTEINRLADEAERHLMHRLAAIEPNRVPTFRIESEIIEYLKRIYYFAKRIAKLVVDVDESLGRYSEAVVAEDQSSEPEPLATAP